MAASRLLMDATTRPQPRHRVKVDGTPATILASFRKAYPMLEAPHPLGPDLIGNLLAGSIPPDALDALSHKWRTQLVSFGTPSAPAPSPSAPAPPSAAPGLTLAPAPTWCTRVADALGLPGPCPIHASPVHAVLNAVAQADMEVMGQVLAACATCGTTAADSITAAAIALLVELCAPQPLRAAAAATRPPADQKADDEREGASRDSGGRFARGSSATPPDVQSTLSQPGELVTLPSGALISAQAVLAGHVFAALHAAERQRHDQPSTAPTTVEAVPRAVGALRAGS